MVELLFPAVRPRRSHVDSLSWRNWGILAVQEISLSLVSKPPQNS